MTARFLMAGCGGRVKKERERINAETAEEQRVHGDSLSERQAAECYRRSEWGIGDETIFIGDKTGGWDSSPRNDVFFVVIRAVLRFWGVAHMGRGGAAPLRRVRNFSWGTGLFF